MELVSGHICATSLGHCRSPSVTQIAEAVPSQRLMTWKRNTEVSSRDVTRPRRRALGSCTTASRAASIAPALLIRSRDRRSSCGLCGRIGSRYRSAQSRGEGFGARTQCGRNRAWRSPQEAVHVRSPTHSAQAPSPSPPNRGRTQSPRESSAGPLMQRAGRAPPTESPAVVEGARAAPTRANVAAGDRREA